MSLLLLLLSRSIGGVPSHGPVSRACPLQQHIDSNPGLHALLTARLPAGNEQMGTRRLDGPFSIQNGTWIPWSDPPTRTYIGAVSRFIAHRDKSRLRSPCLGLVDNEVHATNLIRKMPWHARLGARMTDRWPDELAPFETCSLPSMRPVTPTVQMPKIPTCVSTRNMWPKTGAKNPIHEAVVESCADNEGPGRRLAVNSPIVGGPQQQARFLLRREDGVHWESGESRHPCPRRRKLP